MSKSDKLNLYFVYLRKTLCTLNVRFDKLSVTYMRLEQTEHYEKSCNHWNGGINADRKFSRSILGKS